MTLLLIQMTTVLLTALLCGWLARKLGQSRVIGEIICGILFPFIMAAVVAHSLRIRFAPHGIGSMPFVLFLGIAMSITAFPVLARILEERRLNTTSLGTTAILCAAVDDVVAWLLLAFGLALLGKDGGSASLGVRMAGLVGYLLVMLGVVRPLANLAVKRYKSTKLSLELLGVVVASVLLSAAATDVLGK